MPLSDLWEPSRASSDAGPVGGQRQVEHFPDTVEGQKLKRQKQTANARAKAIAAKALRKFAAKGDALDTGSQELQDERQVFQQRFFGSKTINGVFDEQPHQQEESQRDRRRAVWSYLSAFVSKVAQCFSVV